MLRRVLSFAIVLLTMWSLSAGTNPSAQEQEVIDWVIHRLIEQQKHDWSDWSAPSDRRVVLVASETIPFPTFARDDYAFSYALESLKAEQSDLHTQLRNTSIVDLGTWKPTPHTQCGHEDEVFPEVNVVPGRTLARAFRGKGLEASAALVICMSMPAFSRDGRAAVVYAEAVGSHLENSYRQLISLARRSDRPGEWDAVIHGDRLFARILPQPHERELSTTDRAAMTAALQWLVTARGEFDFVGLTDFPPDPAEWRHRQRQSQTSFEIPEATLAQLSRRNGEGLVFDTSIFSIRGVRNLTAGDKRIWPRPSVLVSLPAYDGEVAILSITYVLRTRFLKPPRISS